MKVFVTGATGFIGSRVVKELIESGYSVIGLTRSDKGAENLAAIGAQSHRGTLDDPGSLRAGAKLADAVIHCAFDHDFSNFLANCEKDKRNIEAMADALIGTSRPMIITSGTGIGSNGPGLLATENVFDETHPNPRIASEYAGQAALKRGVNISVVRLPQVHNTVKQGLITPLIEHARAKKVFAYVGDGTNRWPAAHVDDVALLYKLALEKGQSGSRYHAVAEEGIELRKIAETVAAKMMIPAVSLTHEEAKAHFGWMMMFASLDMSASSVETRKALDWNPTGSDMLKDLKNMDFSQS